MFKMKNNYNFSIVLVLCIVFYLFTFAESKGGSSSGGSGGGGGRGFGGGGGRGGRFGGRRGAAIAIPAAGVVGYAAYQATHKGQGSRFHSNPSDNPAIGTGNHLVDDRIDYKTQESTYYNRGEGFGMSAFGLLALMLGIIGFGTIAYYCCIVGVPLWKDRQRNRRMSTEGHPLQETPSTATPSP